MNPDNTPFIGIDCSFKGETVLAMPSVELATLYLQNFKVLSKEESEAILAVLKDATNNGCFVVKAEEPKAEPILARIICCGDCSQGADANKDNARTKEGRPLK